MHGLFVTGNIERWIPSFACYNRSFTRYAIAVPTRNLSARTAAEAFINNFVLHYGLPQRIHSDQGGSFESKLLKEICNITGIQKSRTAPYHPQGDGLTERFNRTLIGMLGTLEPKQKQDWKSHVGTVVHAYNCTQQETTGHAPFFLMFGRHPRLPIDLAFGLETRDNNKTLTKYAEGLRNRLKHSYELASESIKKAQDKQKKGYDLKVRGAILQPGDRVLVKVVAFEGKHKLADKWEDEPYIIQSQSNEDIPVFVVRKESGTGKNRTLHRNLLLPIGHLSSFDEKPIEKPIPAPRKKLIPAPIDKTRSRIQSRKSDVNSTTTSTVHTDTDSEEEEMIYYYRPDQLDDSIPHDADVEPSTEEIIGTPDDDQVTADESEDQDEVEDAHTPVDETGEILEPPLDDIEHTEGSDETSEHAEENITPEDDDVDDDSDVDEAAESSPVPRLSTRERRAPRWMKDYVSKQAQTSSCLAQNF